MAVPAADSEPMACAYPWQQIVEWMEQDPRTRPIAPPAATSRPAADLAPDGSPGHGSGGGFRDPFFRPRPAEEEEEEAEVAEAEPPPTPRPVHPQDLGASLTGVIAGPDRGAAMINRRTYLVGEEVLLGEGDMSYAFHVAEIRPGTVVLTRDGARFALNLQEASWKTDEPTP